MPERLAGTKSQWTGPSSRYQLQEKTPAVTGQAGARLPADIWQDGVYPLPRSLAT